MKMFTEIEACDFENESYECEYFWERLHDANLEKEFNAYAEDVWPDGVSGMEFNDWIRFDGDDILESIGYKEDND